MDDYAFDTPEEAARGDIPARFIRVVGVVVRGDEAIVAQLQNDKPPYHPETTLCTREDGKWVGGMSDNATVGFIHTGNDNYTYVAWDEAPPSAVAARFEYNDIRLVVQVENGCALAAFDGVSTRDAVLYVPRLAAWIDASGTEEEVPRLEIPEWFKARTLAAYGLGPSVDEAADRVE